MKINVEEIKQKKYVLQIGDIGVDKQSGHAYVVIYYKGSYMLRNLDSNTYWNGFYNTLYDLTVKTLDSDITIYSRDDYELVLKKKEV